MDQQRGGGENGDPSVSHHYPSLINACVLSSPPQRNGGWSPGANFRAITASSSRRLALARLHYTTKWFINFSSPKAARHLSEEQLCVPSRCRLVVLGRWWRGGGCFKLNFAKMKLGKNFSVTEQILAKAKIQLHTLPRAFKRNSIKGFIGRGANKSSIWPSIPLLMLACISIAGLPIWLFRCCCQRKQQRSFFVLF